ncbi:MAG: hypothetical protein AAGH68_00475 [Pseudomonadota bacterium]
MTLIAAWMARKIRHISNARRRARALRELELMDQSALNDLGMSRGVLVAMSHGRHAGRCAAY